MWARGGIKARVDQHLLDARAVMPPRLRACLDRLLAERVLLTGDAAPYFATLGHPLFELPVWVADRLGSDGCPVSGADVSRVLGASALGYLHARARDDWLDGTARDDPRLVALADVLLARGTRLLAEVTGRSPRFWARYDEVVAASAEALLHAEEVRRSRATVTRATFERLLAQSRPLALPSLALLDRAGRWDLAEALEEFVFATAATGQLYDDLTDYHRDRDAGQRTWLVEMLDAAGDSRLAAELLAVPGTGAPAEPAGPVAEAVRAAAGYHDRATAAAAMLGLDGAVGWLARRRAQLDGVQGALRAAFVDALTRRLAPAAAVPGIDGAHPPPAGAPPQDPTREEATA